MPFDKDYLELNDELERFREMDFYRYSTFLNHIEKAFDTYNKIEDEEARQALLRFAKDIIRRFIETYGANNMPENIRKSAQELIISKDWNFN